MAGNDLECTNKGCFTKEEKQNRRSPKKINKKSCQWTKNVQKFSITKHDDEYDEDLSLQSYGVNKYALNEKDYRRHE